MASFEYLHHHPEAPQKVHSVVQQHVKSKEKDVHKSKHMK